MIPGEQSLEGYRFLSSRVRILDCSFTRIWKLASYPLQIIDKRAARRERVIKAGKVSFGCERVDCTVRNLSVTGAMIEVQSSDDIPHEIILDILTSGARRVSSRSLDVVDRHDPVAEIEISRLAAKELGIR